MSVWGLADETLSAEEQTVLFYVYTGVHTTRGEFFVWLGMSTREIDNAIASLWDRGLIEETIHGFKATSIGAVFAVKIDVQVKEAKPNDLAVYFGCLRRAMELGQPYCYVLHCCDDSDMASLALFPIVTNSKLPIELIIAKLASEHLITKFPNTYQEVIHITKEGAALDANITLANIG